VVRHAQGGPGWDASFPGAGACARGCRAASARRRPDRVPCSASRTPPARPAPRRSLRRARATPSRVSCSSTCVARTTGTCAASHIHRISSCTSASRSNPTSTARSLRAIITPAARERSASSSIIGSSRKAEVVLIPISGAPALQLLAHVANVGRAAGKGVAGQVRVPADEGAAISCVSMHRVGSRVATPRANGARGPWEESYGRRGERPSGGSGTRCRNCRRANERWTAEGIGRGGGSCRTNEEPARSHVSPRWTFLNRRPAATHRTGIP
jgi:hypothetical protein